ncbi:peptidase M61 [Novosphingobium sp. KCTC 2891]|uniref:M61 family metallopeptidase n=1 Tax=Novosphingobium sp. KCTC 2891 TaxID=2989730 RepID=UPI0022225E34|nr:peptidase M61 [Novosphingobium sp. KCTC 2891]MCW1382174.1 peptidase M61 [Novosphingobium sp. KCTC 2891]
MTPALFRIFGARTLLAFSLATCATGLIGTAHAQVQPAGNSRPVAVPLRQTVPDPQDVPYPGTIALDIDATDTVTGAFRVTETIPVAPGAARLTLLFPRWLPGNHGTRGPLAELVDVRFSADGKPLAWKRDPVEVNAFHIDLPAGTREVVATMIHTSPLREAEGRITVTREMLNLQWEKMSLYPAGHYVRQVRIKPTVTFPANWTVFTALDGRKASGNRVTWDVTDYETLVDSPVFAGIHAQRFDLGRNVSIDAVADKPELLAIRPENLQAYRNLVEEAQALFGAQHFDHYDFLLALTDRMGGIGLEHHRSSENQMEPRTWIDWAQGDWDRNVVPHEFVHSWNGKFRRPARLWTPDYRQPMQDDLLWVYEGQTQFWGYVLAARSGVQGKDMVLGMLASNAGLFTQYPGREWRSVEDTTLDPVFAARKPKPFPSLARAEEYYTEGALVWLEADQIIREGTGGAKGLDDFARAFFGQRGGDWGVAPYELADVVQALNAVYPYDWAGFLRTRIMTPGQPAPLAGIERGGYRLIWREQPNAYDKGRMDDGKYTNLNHSIGVAIDKEGKISASRWDGPAFRAGLVSGIQVISVNGTAYDAEAIKAAITAAKGTARPIELLVKRDDRVYTLAIDYHDGLRWPWLERVTDGKGPVGLDALLAPRKGGAK